PAARMDSLSSSPGRRSECRTRRLCAGSSSVRRPRRREGAFTGCAATSPGGRRCDPTVAGGRCVRRTRSRVRLPPHLRRVTSITLIPYPAPKQIVDKTVAGVLLALLSPVILVILVAVALDMALSRADRGSVFYR